METLSEIRAFQEKANENAACELAAISSIPQCVNIFTETTIQQAPQNRVLYRWPNPVP